MVLLNVLERSMGFVSILFLARLLDPRDFGIVSMALSFVAMAQLLSAFGFDLALIQNRQVTEEHYHTAWTCNLILGGAIFTIMVVAAEPIAVFYQQPEVFWVVCALAIGPLIGAFENIGVVAFRRDLDFRREFMFQITRKLVSFSIAVPLAYTWRSYWALVASTVGARLAGTLTSYLAHPFRPRWSLRERASLFGFSKWLLLSNVVAFFNERLGDYVIGRASGPSQLGIYNSMYEFAHLPRTEIGSPINRALLPGFARLDEQQVVAAYRVAIATLALFALPAALGLSAIAPYFVPVVLGDKWLAGVPIMEVLAISGALFVFQASIGTVLVAKGRAKAAASLNCVYLLLLAVLMLWATPRYGAVGAAYATLATTALTMPLFFWQLNSRVGVPFSALLGSVARPAAAAIAMWVLVRQIQRPHDPDLPWRLEAASLGGQVLVGALSYISLVLLLWLIAGRPEGAERTILRKLALRLPGGFPGRSTLLK